jgi:hypothetical protein
MKQCKRLLSVIAIVSAGHARILRRLQN